MSFPADSPLLPLRAQAGPPGRLRLAVDLTSMLPGGENGGVKFFALEFLRMLGALEGDRLTLIFLTWSVSHAEAREIARPNDELVCVRGQTELPPDTSALSRPGEICLADPPPDLLIRLAVQALYSPLSSTEFACPGIPLIATVVDVLHRDYPSTLNPCQIAVREANFEALIARASLLQCISDYTADRMQALYDVERARLFRTYIVIQHRLIPSAAGTGRHAGSFFFYPANAWKHKNHETLLVAYRLYRRRAGASAWDLVLTGHEDDRMATIRNCARALGLQDTVSFHGHLPADEFAELWRSAGALVFPSLHEGFGIPLLEAMHFDLPIICSRAGSLPEIAGDAALFADTHDPVALAEKMLELSLDAELRRQLVERGRKRLAAFSLEAEANGFMDALRKTLTADSRLWIKGRYADGWIERKALVALPRRADVCRLSIDLEPSPVPRRLRLYLGDRPFGGYALEAGIEQRIAFDVRLDGSPLVLEVPDAANLNPADHRCHGIRLRDVSIVDATGQSLHLEGAIA